MLKTTLKIDGMMCGMCEAHINDAVRRGFKVKKVSSDHFKGETVILSEAPLDREKLNKAMENIGYKVKSCTSEPYERKGLFFKK